MAPEHTPNRVDDIELAYDMALAENEFRPYELMARAVVRYATDEIQNLNKALRASGSEWIEPYDSKVYRWDHLKLGHDGHRVMRYFSTRADHASAVVQAEHDDNPAPTFYYRRDYENGSEKLLKADRSKKLEAMKMALALPNVTDALGLDHQDLQQKHSSLEAQHRAEYSEESAVRKRISKQEARQQLAATITSLDSTENKLLHKLLEAPSFKGDVITAEAITAFNELPPLEAMNLIAGFVRKQAIGPTVYEFIAKQAWSQLLTSAPETLSREMDVLPTRHWNSTAIMKTAESLLGKFNGTVTDVSVMKLPVEEAWLEEYFEDDALNRIYADSVSRLRFIATLKPTGKPAEYSVLDCTTYIREVEGQTTPAIIATTRKADRLTAEALQASLRQESIAVARVVESNQRHEVLSGLPTLGKRR